MKNKQNFMWSKMTMGVCYYPEHWDRSLWADDLTRMKECGIEVIRIAEFSWNKIEPSEGHFEWEFFDDFLALCAKHNMKVIFGTPTATPPIWLTEKYPEVLNSKKDGTLLRHGGRRHYNYNSHIYRELSARIVEEEAKRYAKNVAVIGWQIDNELNCEWNEFYSESDNAAFRVFLEKKYITTDALNRAWGTAFWNQTYNSWEEIYVPGVILNDGYNPHQMLDYIRFISDSVLSFCDMQASIIRKYVKEGDFITTNGIFGHMDNHRMMRESLDIYHYDSYPNFGYMPEYEPNPKTGFRDRNWSKKLTEVRSVCPHFGIMEQQSGANGWISRMEAPAPRPRQLSLWAMQSVAHGSDFISFFRWRTCAFGTEQYWHGILDYDNRDNRKLKEVKEFNKRLSAMNEMCGAEHVAVFGVIADYDNEWDSEYDVWHKKISKESEQAVFEASQLYHAPYDIINLDETTEYEDLQDFPVLIYPHPVIADKKEIAPLEEYVSKGGILVLGCRAGMKDKNGICPMEPMPGPFKALTGTYVTDFSLASPTEPLIMAEVLDAGLCEDDIEMPVFNDILKTDDTSEILAVYKNGYFKDEPAITKKRTGDGYTIHFGSVFSISNLKVLFKYLNIYEPFSDIVDAPAELEILVRRKGEKRYLFVLNYEDHEEEFVLRNPARDIFTGKMAEGSISLCAFGTAVYEIMPKKEA